MRKPLVLFFVIACVLLIMPVASSQVNSAAIRASMNTAFVVGDAQLPAGEYVFAFDSSANRMRITNVDTLETIAVFAQERVENSTPTENKLKLQTDGDQLVLHKVWSASSGHVYDILHGTDVMELE